MTLSLFVTKNAFPQPAPQWADVLERRLLPTPLTLMMTVWAQLLPRQGQRRIAQCLSHPKGMYGEVLAGVFTANEFAPAGRPARGAYSWLRRKSKMKNPKFLRPFWQPILTEFLRFIRITRLTRRKRTMGYATGRTIADRASGEKLGWRLATRSPSTYDLPSEFELTIRALFKPATSTAHFVLQFHLCEEAVALGSGTSRNFVILRLTKSVRHSASAVDDTFELSEPQDGEETHSCRFISMLGT